MMVRSSSSPRRLPIQRSAMPLATVLTGLASEPSRGAAVEEGAVLGLEGRGAARVAERAAASAAACSTVMLRGHEKVFGSTATAEYTISSSVAASGGVFAGSSVLFGSLSLWRYRSQ